jgi:hypothetical protein
MSDQLVAEAATYTTRTNTREDTPKISAGIEPAIPAIERAQTYALPATAISQ